MSTPPSKSPAPKDRFRLLSAILTGLTLGFLAVLLAPYSLSLRQALQSLAQTVENGTSSRPSGSSAPQKHGSAHANPSVQPYVGAPVASGQGKNEDGKAVRRDEAGRPQVPAAPEAAKDAKDAKQEPVLVPAFESAFPKPFSNDEMTAALQPLLSFELSEEDSKAVKQALEAASREDDDGARTAIRKIGDPAAKAFAEWRRLRQHGADFKEVMMFRAAHPLFPESPQDSLLEKKLFLSEAPAATVLKFYANRVPLTGAGHGNLGAALMESGERERGLSMIKYGWHRFALDPAAEEKFRSRFGSLLTADDNARRERMLAVRTALKDDKIASENGRKGLKALSKLRSKTAKANRKRPTKAARRRGRRGADVSVPHRLAPGGRAADMFGVTSLALPVRMKKAAKSNDSGKNAKAGTADDEKPAGKTTQAKAAENAVNLAKRLTAGPGTLLVRFKALRREGDDNELWSLLRSTNPDSADLADPDRWWDFRRSEIRRALSEDHPKTAYAIAKAHGPLEGENGSEAEFLAGWIALRFLKDTHRAIPHFEASRAIGFARTEGRADYWLGRAKLELGQQREAQANLTQASNRFFTFYGALAREVLHKTAACEFRAPPNPSKETIAAFVSEDAFKAVIIAKQLGLETILITYVLDLARQINDPEQMTLVMELAGRTVPVHVAVHAAKIALLRGFAADAYAYPTLLPKFGEAGNNAKLELALLNALTRQESEFHTGTISRAGARGLMQLMPETARHVAAAIKMKYEMGRLISDPSYNVTLGSVFLAQLLSGYDGSYVLSLAAYNAGPGRVSGWIKDFGDPRDKSVDPVDWVERIPFAETRNYVQRILESVQLYRCRLESSKTRFQLAEDLHRGRPGKLPDFIDVAGSADLDQAP
jgi:soluble lytic murein transglycosylase